MENFKNESSNQLYSALITSPLFNKLNPQHLNKLVVDYAHLQQYFSKGSIIYNENDLCRHMDLLVKGTLIIQQIDEYGNMLSITKFSKGQSLAGNILFSKKNQYPMTITAVTDVILLPLTQKDVLELSKSQIFLRALIEDISERATILSHTIKNITRKSLRNKLIDYFIILYAKQNSESLTLPTTKTDLANTFGVARPSLSRELSQMQKDGLLSYDKKTILLSPTFIDLYINNL